MSQMVQLEGGSMTQNVVVDKRFMAQSDLERNVSTASSEYVRYAPIGGSQGQQIEFQIEPSVGYIDLKNSYIHTPVRIRYNGGDLPTGTGQIGPKAFLSLLQWTDIRSYVNDVELSDENSGLYPYSAWAKTALSESNLVPSVATIIPANANSLSVLSSNDARVTEGIVSLNSGPLCGGLTSMTSQYMRIRYYDLTTAAGYIDVKTKPKDGIWNQPDYLQPNLRIRCVLTKNTNNQVIENADLTTGTFTLDYGDVYLYLKRVYPTPSMGTIAKQAQIDSGMLYTLLRARTAQVQFLDNQTSLTATGLLAGQNPSVVVVSFLPVYNSTVQFQHHAFNSAIEISNLYIRSGGMRIPENYDYTRIDTTQANSLIDYNEYLHACKASSLNSTLSDNDVPLISYEAYKSVSFYVFNCKSNKSTMWGQDDSSNSKGAVDVYARFPSGGTGAQSTMIVVGLGHDQVHISHDGKVQRLGW